MAESIQEYVKQLRKPSVDTYYDMTQFDTLTTLVMQAYQKFAKYPSLANTGVCECELCFHEPLPTYWATFTHVKDIPDEILQRYFCSTADGDKAVIQWQMHALLPRILDDFIQGKEYGIAGRNGMFDCCQFSNLKLGGWQADELAFMQEFALTYFDIYINHLDGWHRFSEFDGAMDIVTMFYMAGLDIQPLLSLWLASLDKLLPCLYLGLIVRMQLEDGKFFDFLTEDDPYYHQLINDWLTTNAGIMASALRQAKSQPEFVQFDESDQVCITDGLTYFQNLIN